MEKARALYYQSPHVRVEWPEGARGEQVYPEKEALLYRDRKFLHSLRQKLSGQWAGHSCSADQNGDLSFRLLFEDSLATGTGQDSGGVFVLEGSYSDSDQSLHLTKKYATHAVEYQGYYKGDRTFSGGWWISGSPKGFFELTKGLESGKGLLPSPAELGRSDHAFVRSLETDNHLAGDWIGHCTQGDTIYDLTLSLVFSRGSVSGSGSDMAGKFTWSGLYDPREMHLSLIKLYPSHRVYFNGFYRTNRTFEGDWVIDDHAHGIFRVSFQA